MLSDAHTAECSTDPCLKWVVQPISDIREYSVHFEAEGVVIHAVARHIVLNPVYSRGRPTDGVEAEESAAWMAFLQHG